MFERLKKVFTAPGATPEQPLNSVVSEWAGTRGFAYSEHPKGESFVLSGKVAGKVWKIELGRPSRDFIEGKELRGRAELGINEDVAVLIMNRPLKEQLEKRAYALYTDTLQTTADPSLPEEMRWLSMYPETGWDSLPSEFWARYAVMADDRSHALTWVDQNLAETLLSWPEPSPGADNPFILMLLRGKAYLRMQYAPADAPTLQHAAVAYTNACESAIAGLTLDASL